jgi:hypothetical protein
MSRVAVHAIVATGLLIAALATAAQETTIEGIWEPDPSRSERFPTPPPLTPEGKRIVDEWRTSHDPIEDDPGKFCQSPGMPSLALGGASYPVEIIATSKQVTVLMEMHQQVRRVHLDQAEHPARLFPQRNGHSIGRWEGATLVIDTAAIKAIPFGSVPHSDRVHVVERIGAIDDGAALVNEVTITDPVMYTRPVTVRQYYKAAPRGTRMLEYECAEGMWAEHEERRGIRASR